MLMSRPTVRAMLSSAAALLTVAVACTHFGLHGDEEVARSCDQAHLRFDTPITSQLEAFRQLDLQAKYAAFLCGMRRKHPPAMHLALALSGEGAAVVRILKTKLDEGKSDVTINDILFVLGLMSQNDSYDVASDMDLMSAAQRAVKRIRDPYWRDSSERALSKIEAAGTVRSK